MLTRWSQFDRDFGRGFATFGDLWRQMDHLVRELERPLAGVERGVASTRWPLANLYDTGTELVLYAAVPGLSEADLQITAQGDVVSISGARRVEVPEGYSTHRQERGAVTFNRSFALPTKVELERVTATVKDGMLTLRLPKAPEAQPRQITVKAR
jgi:HSP20 family protein